MTRAPLLAAAAALLSCGTNFEPQYLVKDLRVLAARAQVANASSGVADADAGETLILSALVANPQGLPGVTVRWKACLPQLGESVSPCLDPAVLRDPAALERTGVDLGEGTTLGVTVPASLAPVLRQLVDRTTATPELACTLYAELPILAIASAPGATPRVAVKTARLTPWREVVGTPLADVYVRNRNPALERVRAAPTTRDPCLGGVTAARPCATDGDCDDPAVRCDRARPGSATAPGQCASARPAAPIVLCAEPRGDARQIYNQCQSTGERVQFFEDLSFQWYVTGGAFKDAGGGAFGSNGNVTSGDVTFTPPPGPFTMWVVLRDGRGGEDWITRDFP